MSFKEQAKKIIWIKKVYYKIREYGYSMATIISPEFNTRIHYRRVFGKKLNLKNPQTFNEKILWLKLNKYIKDPLVAQCVDKVKVRDYVKSCGCEKILNEVIGVYDSAEDIPWDELPNQFVLKWNFGAGMNIVCSDKNKLDKDTIIKKMKKWGKNRYWLLHSEMQYKYTIKKIICEKYLSDKNEKSLPDYKVYCFNGEPKAIFVMHDRNDKLKTEFYDTEWNLLENTSKYEKPDKNTPKPKCLVQMLKVSKKLSIPFPFVRCDYYIVDDKLYFGELTFTPAGGLHTSETKVNGKEMSELLNI